MDFDSPDTAKEFPGLYLAESGKGSDPQLYTDDGEKKKSKKEKKDSKKDKGYSALAAESSHDEDEHQESKSPGKGKKIKAFSKLSGKKKDKDKDKEKKLEKSDKEQKKAEKTAKEKRKSEERERRDVTSVPGPSAPKHQIPFSGTHLLKSNGLNLLPNSPSTKELEPPSARSNIVVEDRSAKETPLKPSKEKLNAFNVFLNAPAPLLHKLKDRDILKDGKKEQKVKDKHKHKDKGERTSKKEDGPIEKEKDAKKEHTQATGMAKMKLKLMRSKNSLEDCGDPPHIVCHQFPEDSDSLTKEIKKYEGLLEQAHGHLKSSKKITKKQEEQLWELQRTLTQLKRKLRSLNALSSATVHPISSTQQHEPVLQIPQSSLNSIFKKCDSIDVQGPKRNFGTEADSEIKLEDGAEDADIADIADAVGNRPGNSVPQCPIPSDPLPPVKIPHSVVENCASSATSSIPVTSQKSQSTLPSNEENTSGTDSAKSLDSEVQSSPNDAANIDATERKLSSPISAVQSPRPIDDTVISDADGVSDDECVRSVVEIEENKKLYSNSNRGTPVSDNSSDLKENIETVLDDANKMIDSMNEKFESTLDSMEGGELEEETDFPYDEDPDVDAFRLPMFSTVEYLLVENEALALFHDQLKEDLNKEQNELDALMLKMHSDPVRSDAESKDESASLSDGESDTVDVLTVWGQLKSENENLLDNVYRLRLAVAASRVDELRLMTRWKYLETASIRSPVTTSSPLPTEG